MAQRTLSGCNSTSIIRLEQRGEESGSKWKLGVAALLGWMAWILGFSSLVLAFLVYQVVDAAKDPDMSSDFGLLLTSVGSRSAAILIAVLGSGSYLVVAVRQPRPRELHRHGLILLLMLPEIFGNQPLWGEFGVQAALWPEMVKFIPWGIRRVLFIRLAVKKMSALGPPELGCGGIGQLGRVINVLTIFITSAGLVYQVWLNIMVLRGVGINGKTRMNCCPRWTVADFLIIRGIYFSGLAAALAMQVLHVVFMCACQRLIKGARAKLVTRGIDAEMMVKVKRKLRRHLVGICLNLSTTVLILASGLIDGGNLLQNEELENVIFSLCQLLDLTGDTIGILLLSGIGLLLRRENPEAGNSAVIRSLLHSAVLSSRVDTTFEGAVFKNYHNCCIASFPGKFLDEWRSLTWLCEQQTLSAACVFLPQSDPKSRFGQHVQCPETPGDCWCFSLYGASKPWGCKWFEAWKENIEEAVRLELDLVVVFFPGQRGQGLVKWSDLGTSDLWDGDGLGGSQKAEVAYLERQGYAFIQEDLQTTRLRLSSVHVGRKRGGFGQAGQS